MARTRCSTRSARSARDSLRRTRPNPVTMAASSSRPATAETSRAPPGRPLVSMSATARTGSPNRAKTFQIPEMSVYRRYSAAPTSQLESIAQLTPIARAPPAGSVLATALEPRLTTAASRSRIDGNTEEIMIHHETMLATAAAAMTSICGAVIAAMLDHTLR
jgi:hypothetical protein